MDSVPYKFVDSVVELFDKKTLDRLAQEVENPLWKSAIKVHHRHREYCHIFLQTVEGGTQVFSGKGASYGELEEIQKDRRFARIVCINNISKDPHDKDNWEVLEEAEAVKKLEAVVPQFDQGAFLISNCDPPDGQRIMVSALFNRIRLGTMYLSYHGQMTLDFLEDQINNSPYLTTVKLEGGKWPKSVVPLIRTLCLKGRPDNYLSIYMIEMMETTEKIIDMDFIQKLFDHWKARGNLHFRFVFSQEAMDTDGLDALLQQAEVLTNYPDELRSTFAHETKNSIASLTKLHFNYHLQFRSCACGLVKRCALKESYPQFHNF